eukprot:499616-Alexandrium_andersonii.AAC.1
MLQKWSPKLRRGALSAMLRADCEDAGEHEEGVRIAESQTRNLRPASPKSAKPLGTGARDPTV